MRRRPRITVLPAQTPHVPELSLRRRFWLATAPLTAPMVRLPRVMLVRILKHSILLHTLGILSNSMTWHECRELGK